MIVVDDDDRPNSRRRANECDSHPKYEYDPTGFIDPFYIGPAEIVQ